MSLFADASADLAIADAAAGGRVTGLDFSEPMLERARRKAPSLEWIQGDVLELPFEDASFDAATVGFGVLTFFVLSGYLITGIKDVTKLRVGDTLTIRKQGIVWEVVVTALAPRAAGPYVPLTTPCITAKRSRDVVYTEPPPIRNERSRSGAPGWGWVVMRRSVQQSVG